MGRAWLRRIATTFPFVAILAVTAFASANGQGASDIELLSSQAAKLYAQGKYGQATPLMERLLATRERVLGKQHPDTLTSMANLAELYRLQGRYNDAEPLFRGVIEARERVLGKEHAQTVISVNNLARLYKDVGRYAEAELLLTGVLEGSERALGKEHPETLLSMSNLAGLYYSQGRYGEAEPLYRRALDASERILGKEHPHTLIRVGALAAFYNSQGRYSEAEPLFRRALDASERVLGKEHPETLTIVGNLGVLYYNQGRYGEAERLIRRDLEGNERVLGKEHPDTLDSVHNLASIYQNQGRFHEAELLYRRALEARERVLGKEHPQTIFEVRNLAGLYEAQRRYSEAEPFFRLAFEASERALGKQHPQTLASLATLGQLYRLQGRYSEAEPLLRRALEDSERVLGKENPATLNRISNLAALYHDQDRYSEAELLYCRDVETSERVLGKDHPHTFVALSNLASLYYDEGNWTGAVELWRRSFGGITKRSLNEAVLSRAKLFGLLQAAYRLTPKGRMPDAGLTREMFETTQWALISDTALSLAQMAARGAKSDTQLAALVREGQDLLLEWRKRDALRTDSLGKAEAKRNAKAEADNFVRLVAIEKRTAEIDQRVALKFPDYDALAKPTPLTAEEVQAQLSADEALVFMLDVPKARNSRGSGETFIWVLTKTDVRWARSDLGTEELTDEVQAIRCGLDDAAWDGSRCATLTGQPYSDAARNASKPLPFDHARAHKLYRVLFGQVEDLIKGKQLLVVPSGPLTQLPFQVLVTAPPASGDDKSPAWLIREHALTVLPTVSSLKALRSVARPSSATKPMVGFGNPLLEGDATDPFGRQRAQLAREKQRCPETTWQRPASLAGLRRGVAPVQTRSGLADVDFLRIQTPLPETADELCAVARDMHADTSKIYLGARATEREVKRLSGNGLLAQYRIVHFATHGALAGQMQGNAEPGLLLTPPDRPSEEDDGYLSASEIAGLKLDAEWVILSACNTAAGGTEGAGALSGLARAFIYAQARALLVSHWAVNSDATVKLITGAISRLAANQSIGRAEAMRQSMLALIDKGTPEEAHPAYWAPFVVVGEGGAKR